jgi:hypothetical protein
VSEETIRVCLSVSQQHYLAHADYLPPSIFPLVARTPPSPGRLQLVIARDLAEQVRDALTTRLAKAGFDEDYEPNSEGRLLEDLIDAFFPDQVS